MTDPETPRGKEESSQETPRKRRKRGYRGYPNLPSAPGDVHAGSGFGGAGSVSRSSNPIEKSVISERTREDVEKD
jgi:hypothetical protein